MSEREPYVVAAQWGTTILGLGTAAGQSKYIVAFELREGGPSQTALLEWLASLRAWRLLPGVWHFDAPAGMVGAFRDAVQTAFALEPADEQTADQKIMLHGGGEMFLYKKGIFKMEAIPESEVPRPARVG